ncbi:MAG TPA: hypothetical protein EYG73_09020 [Arcobacter sp.]|nr:hypothetical protein [Arcobacter sp.]
MLFVKDFKYLNVGSIKLTDLEGSFKNITAFFIDIRNYTKLSNVKSPEVVINFIKEYRNLVNAEFKSDSGSLKDNICEIIYIGDAVLIILNSDNTETLKKTINCAKKVRDKMFKLLSIWQSDDSYTGVPLSFFKNISFGIGISQGKVYVESSDYIGSPLNHAAKIGDMRELSNRKTHIGIDKEVFSKLHSENLTKNSKCVGQTKDNEYVDLLIFENEYREIDD